MLEDVKLMHEMEKAPLHHDRLDEAQLNIKGDREVLERFRQIAKQDGFRFIGLYRDPGSGIYCAGL